jgi:hypothetical protein
MGGRKGGRERGREGERRRKHLRRASLDIFVVENVEAAELLIKLCIFLHMNVDTTINVGYKDACRYGDICEFEDIFGYNDICRYYDACRCE